MYTEQIIAINILTTPLIKPIADDKYSLILSIVNHDSKSTFCIQSTTGFNILSCINGVMLKSGLSETTAL